jgi:hypothetical protein
MGLFDVPNPVGYYEQIRDEDLKREMIALSTSIVYSQYITFLYETGIAIEGKWLAGVFSQALIKMAASMFKMLMLQDSQKLVYTGVPIELVEDAKLLDSIHYEKEQNK